MSNNKPIMIGSWTLKKVIITSLLALVALIVVSGSFYVNSEYQRAVVTKFGEYNRSTGPGIHFKIPIIEGVHKADTRISELNYPTEVVATKDGQTLTIDLTVNHQILPDDVNIRNLYASFGNNFSYEDRILNRMAIDRIKGVIGEIEMENFMSERDNLRTSALMRIQEEAAKYGINIVDVQFANFEFDPRFRERLNDVAAARARAAEAHQNERRAGFLANIEIEQARGQAESQKLDADARAHRIRVESTESAAATERQGDASAAAELALGMARIEIMEREIEALKAGGPELVMLRQAEAMKNWNGEFNPSTVINSGGNGGNSDGFPGFIPFMNYNQLIEGKGRSGN